MIPMTRNDSDVDVMGHGFNRPLDELRLIVEERQADARHLAVGPIDFGAGGASDRHGVLARLLRDLQPHAGLAVDPLERAQVLRRVADFGDVSQIDRHGAPRQYDQIANLVEVRELALAAEQVGRVALVHLAERDVLILRADRLDDAVHRKVERGDLFLGQLDVNLAPQAAHDRGGRHTLDALEARHEVVFGDFTERHAVEVAFDADAHDGLGR